MDSDFQKVLLYFGGGIFVVLNVVFSFYSPSTTEAKKIPDIHQTRGIDGKYHKTYWSNPTITWIEKRFCNGFERSDSCSYSLRHPFAPAYANKGKAIPDGRPDVDAERVINYTYQLPRKDSLKSRITLGVDTKDLE